MHLAPSTVKCLDQVSQDAYEGITRLAKLVNSDNDQSEFREAYDLLAPFVEAAIREKVKKIGL